MLTAEEQFEKDSKKGIRYHIWTIDNWMTVDFPNANYGSNFFSRLFLFYMGFKNENEETQQYIKRMIQKSNIYECQGRITLCLYKLGLEFIIEDEETEIKTETKHYYNRGKIGPFGIADLIKEVPVQYNIKKLRYNTWGRGYNPQIKQLIKHGKIKKLAKPNVVNFT